MIISVIGSIHQKCTIETLRELMETLISSSHDHRVRIDEKFYDYLWSLGIEIPVKHLSNVRNDPQTDILISLGGDGTFLRAAKLIANTDASIIGINTGRLGFLANMLPQEIKKIWQRILDGEYSVEERRMLEVYTRIKENRKSFGVALNEVAILKRDTASMISVHTKINNEYVATFEGDGVIVATPTGSTGYALSVNGPIVVPSCPTLSICPVAPHMLNMRPIVIPDNVQISMRVSTRNDTYLLCTDGFSHSLNSAAEIFIAKSDKVIRVIKHPELSFYDTLRDKLMWGQDIRSDKGDLLRP